MGSITGAPCRKSALSDCCGKPASKQGSLFNGGQLRLVVAPKGESSGHLTFPLQKLAEVGGRLMFSGLDLLLGQSRVFFDPDGARLADVLKASRSFQAVVSNTLADRCWQRYGTYCGALRRQTNAPGAKGKRCWVPWRTRTRNGSTAV